MWDSPRPHALPVPPHKNSRIKVSRKLAIPRNSRKFSPAKVSGYTVSITTIKKHLRLILWNSFISHFQSSNPCSFHYLCPCVKCVNLPIYSTSHVGHQFVFLQCTILSNFLLFCTVIIIKQPSRLSPDWTYENNPWCYYMPTVLLLIHVCIHFIVELVLLTPPLS